MKLMLSKEPKGKTRDNRLTIHRSLLTLTHQILGNIVDLIWIGKSEEGAVYC